MGGQQFQKSLVNQPNQGHQPWQSNSLDPTPQFAYPSTFTKKKSCLIDEFCLIDGFCLLDGACLIDGFCVIADTISY